MDTDQQMITEGCAPMGAVSSMTGSSEVEGSFGGYNWKWVLDSVNRPTLDVTFRPPSGYEWLKTPCRAALEQRFVRGTIVIKFTITTPATDLRFNNDKIEQVLALQERYKGKVAKATIPEILAIPHVMSSAPASPDQEAVKALRHTLGESFLKAADALLIARDDEGKKIEKHLVCYLDQIANLISKAQVLPATQPDAIRKRIEDQIARYLGNIDGEKEQGLMKEAGALVLDSMNVWEEITRLTIHIQRARDLLKVDPSGYRKAIGSRLENTGKEFERETNTFGDKSKSSELIILAGDLRIAAKSFREQCANVQ